MSELLMLLFTRLQVKHEVNSLKNQSQLSYMMMEQYWLGKTKPIQIDLKCFQKVTMELLV